MKRGLSEIVGALLVSSIIIAMAVAWVAWESPTLTKQTLSIIEVIRAVEKRQSQLLSLLYYYRSSEVNPKLLLYIYNYGRVPATIKNVYIKGVLIAHERLIVKDAASGRIITNYLIEPRETVEVTVLGAPVEDTLTILLLTEEGGMFVWEIHV